MRIYEISPGHPVQLAERPRWPLSTGQMVQTVDGLRRVVSVTTITVSAPGVEQVDRIILGEIVDPFGAW